MRFPLFPKSKVCPDFSSLLASPVMASVSGRAPATWWQIWFPATRAWLTPLPFASAAFPKAHGHAPKAISPKWGTTPRTRGLKVGKHSAISPEPGTHPIAKGCYWPPADPQGGEMGRLTLLLTGSALATALALPALAQTNETTPEEEVTAGEAPASGAEAPAPGEPVETRPPTANKPPAFEGQTRAPQPETMPEVAHEVVAEDLPQLSAMEFLPNGDMLVTAKEGSMHILSSDGTAGPPLEGVAEVDARGQGGLLDVALAPDFEESNEIFFTFSEPREDGNGTSVARATLVLDDA